MRITRQNNRSRALTSASYARASALSPRLSLSLSLLLWLLSPIQLLNHIKLMTVTVPAGIVSGMSFMAPIMSPRGQQIQVVCPAGACAGQEIIYSRPCKIAIISPHNRYLSAQGDGSVQFNRDKVEAWEEVTVVPAQKGGRWVGLRSVHGKFLSAQSNGMLEWNRDTMGPYEEFELLEDTEVVHKVPVKKRRPTSVVPTSADYLKPLKLHKKYAKKFDAKGYEDVESLREHVVEDEIDIDKMMAEFEMLPPHARKLLKSLEK